MGPGWTTDEFGNKIYDPNTPDAPAYPEQDFTGTLHSLGIGDMFEGSTLETDWSKYFEHYDPTKEQMFTSQATTDIGQAKSTWDLQQKQLKESWGEQLGGLGESFRLQTGGLGKEWQSTQAGFGAQARQGLGQVSQMGQQMSQRGRGLTFGGERIRQSEQNVMENYRRAFSSGESAYEQAISGATMGLKRGIGRGQLGYEQALETGQLGFEQARTDIYQGLERDIFGTRSAWEQRQKDLATTLMQDDIWDVEQTTDQPWQSGVPPGVNAGDTQPVPGQGYPDSTDPNRTWYWNESEGWYTVGSEGESLNIYQTLCFTGDTRIITINGPKIIESVNSGDIVMTFDLKKNKLKKSKVTKTFKHKNPDGYIVINDILKTTPNHPFYSNGEWKEAGKLLIGDKILHIDGVEHKVKSIDVVDKSLDVYNIEVDGTHNYFAEGYLVHNK